MLKAQVMEALLYGCAKWSMKTEPYGRRRSIHHGLLPRCVGSQKRNRTDNVVSNQSKMARTRYETVESTVHKWRELLAANIVRMNVNRLPKQLMQKCHRGRRGGGGRKQCKVCLKDDFLKPGMEPEGWEGKDTDKFAWKSLVEEGVEKYKTMWTAKEQALRHSTQEGSCYDTQGGGRIGSG